MIRTSKRGSVVGIAALLTGMLGGLTPWASAQAPGDEVASEITHPMPPNDEPQYPFLPQEQKDEGHPPAIAGGPTTCSGNGLGLFYPFNSANTTGWTSALARSDDGSSVEITLGFTFRFYGVNHTSCFINNNGNITFGAAFGTYVPTGFPSATVPPMIAPFWADVDTRNTATGRVWYKIIDSNSGGLPDTLIVTWDNVGYFNSHSDLQNTFQLVISNFTNPAMPVGANVCFDYDNMCWTTGDINGVNGFTNPPSATTGNATVGINRGSGGQYFQVGRFGIAGSAYDGPFGNADGVSYLDNKRFCFNTDSLNVPPIPSGFPTGNTRTVAAGQTMSETVQFLSPEFGQSTNVVIVDEDGAVARGLVITNTPGNVATVGLSWATGCTDVGTYNIRMTARDNFVPQGVTQASVTIIVSEVNTVPTVVITDPISFECICDNHQIRGTANGTNFNSYTLEYSANPAGPYTLITSSTTPVVNGILGTWDTTPIVTQGYYYLRLRATNDCGPTAVAFVLVWVDKVFDTIDLRSPGASQILGGTVCLDGTVYDNNCFDHYTVEVAASPFTTFNPVPPGTFNTPISNDPIASWNAAAVADGTYRLRITGFTTCGVRLVVTRDVIIDNTVPIGVITAPVQCAHVSGVIPVRGTASDAHLAGWTLQYTGGASHTWVTIASGNTNVVNGLFANWNTAGLTRCTYTLRLIVSDSAGVNCSGNTHQTEYLTSVDLGSRCDVNGDGLVNNLDIDPFVQCLINGGEPEPEP